MAAVTNLLDPYERRARFYPVVLVLLPLALSVASWMPSDVDLLALAGSAVFGVGCAAFLTQLARDQGRNKEPELFRAWGGKPSEQALSYKGGVFGETTLSRCHRKLATIDPELRFPEDADQEEENLAEAARVYESANDLLLGRTRDREKYHLVFEENVNYGYRRNLWGMKPAGVAAALLGLGAGVGRLIASASTAGDIAVTPIVSGIAGVTLVVLWLFHVRPSWVKVAADAYARQLVMASEVLEVG